MGYSRKNKKNSFRLDSWGALWVNVSTSRSLSLPPASAERERDSDRGNIDIACFCFCQDNSSRRPSSIFWPLDRALSVARGNAGRSIHQSRIKPLDALLAR